VLPRTRERKEKYLLLKTDSLVLNGDRSHSCQNVCHKIILKGLSTGWKF